ncbi:MAG: hypothetical protein OXE84_14125 [Rhodobacteraceae bacterium]|nr:hypothetical protein [Paracoccaceae bacterium]MCY4196313.1 hypothetical protein [Paracoccaceae bacterium]
MDDSLGGCFALAEFDGGAFLRVGFADDPADLYLLIGDADWGAVEADTLYPIGLQFDTGPLQDLDPPWTGEAMGTRLDDGTGALYLHLHDALDMKAVFLDALARRQRLTVTHAGTAIANLSLRGSRVAIDDVLACQRRRVRPDLVE